MGDGGTDTGRFEGALDVGVDVRGELLGGGDGDADTDTGGEAVGAIAELPLEHAAASESTARTATVR